MPSFSAARVLFHLHSRIVFSSNAFSTCAAARLVTCSSVPSQSNFSGSIPAGNLASSGFVVGICSASARMRSEEHTSELQSHSDLVCRLLLEKKKKRRRLEL